MVNSVIVAPTPVGAKPQFVSYGVADGASAISGAVTPGKVVVLYGERMGPDKVTFGALAKDGRLAADAAGTQVTFNDVPAPIIYTSAGQLSAIVPYALDGATGAQIRVKYGNNTSEPVAVPVVPAAPSIFSANYTGAGQGAIQNQNGSTNSAANPADKGSVVVIYATGEGQTLPSGVDGFVANANTLPRPKLATKVYFAGKEAEVLYSGASPGSVAGLLQVNARVPADAPSGNVAVEVQVGTAKSTAGVTVAVK